MLDQHDPQEYGRRIAEDYDRVTSHLDPSDAVETLALLARGGPVLEFGVGTGRIALPLHRRGVKVSGIESSPDMAAALSAKPDGDAISLTMGDFTRARAKGDFTLVFLAYSTIFALPTQDAQVQCFRNAGRHLIMGGTFVVEAIVPRYGALAHGGRGIEPVFIGKDRVVLEVSDVHTPTQTARTSKIFIDSTGCRAYPADNRYAWPAELDLMARLAGFTLEHRWAGWSRMPFNEESGNHVTTWRKVSEEPW